ncbi:MAG: antitoxin Xre/MbcA/ParS toxin-binding domain-containing protein [Pseudomonadota bacterium]
MQLVPVASGETPPFDQKISAQEAAAMARAVVNLFDRWGLTDAQARTLLGEVSAATYNRWKKGSLPRLSVDLCTRLSILMGIHKALRILFSDNARAYRWVMAPNQAFGGKTALDIMLGGTMTDLMRVRHYLDAQRG